MNFETVALRSDLLMVRNQLILSPWKDLISFGKCWRMVRWSKAVQLNRLMQSIGESTALHLDLDVGGIPPGREYHLKVKAVTRKGTALIPAGHKVASQQFSMTPPPDGRAAQKEFMAVGSDEGSVHR